MSPCCEPVNRTIFSHQAAALNGQRHTQTRHGA
jgi:hypothetical protein